MISIIASVSTLLVGGFNINVASATAFTEISTIFLHIRYYMLKAKRGDGVPFILVMFTFISLFIYSRLYVQYFVVKRMYHGFVTQYNSIASREPLILYLQYIANTMMFSLCMLNIYWFTLLYKGVMIVYKKGMGSSSYGERMEIKKKNE
jgi:hypothetical protein